MHAQGCGAAGHTGSRAVAAIHFDVPFLVRVRLAGVGAGATA
jgi:hypothetical protein